MEAVSSVLSENWLLCSICLDVFSDPVSTSCGHNFCKTCIFSYWDHRHQYQCPVCKEEFSTRPQLKTNTCLSEMVSQFRARQKTPVLEEPADPAEAGHVPCDMCCDPRLRAVRSCLVCLASYCPTHLEPHLSTPRLLRHQLISATENLEERICHDHNKPLELLCQKENTLICFQCTFSEHKGHTAVPLREESERQQAELKTLIEQRRQKILEIQDSVKINKKNADREMTDGVKVFTALMQSVQTSQDQFKERITADQKKVEDRAAELMEELTQEIMVLQQREAEMEQLSEDHFRFVQHFASVKPAPVLKTWTKVKIAPQSFSGLVARAVSKLDKTLQAEIKKVSEAELRRVQLYEIDVTLDPDTAHLNLVVLDDNKVVSQVTQKRSLPDLPQRFSTTLCVLGKQKFSSGKSYFQVQVKDNNAWFVGIVKESFERKKNVGLKPQNGCKSIVMQDDQYWANDIFSVPLSLKSRPDTVGIFVDYDKGVVSFYNVNTAELLYSFNRGCFTENLLPFFAFGRNKDGKLFAPLIITSHNKKRKYVSQGTSMNKKYLNN